MLNRFWRHVRGGVAIEFAFVFPLLLAFTIAVLEFGIILFDYHRAGEATRRGVRDLVINPPLAALDALVNNGSVVCIGSDASVSCTGGAVDGDAATTFAALVARMQDVFSTVAPQNVSICRERRRRSREHQRDHANGDVESDRRAVHVFHFADHSRDSRRVRIPTVRDHQAHLHASALTVASGPRCPGVLRCPGRQAIFAARTGLSGALLTTNSTKASPSSGAPIW